MKNISIFTFVHTIFMIAISAVIVAFVFFVQWDKERFFSEQRQKYTLISDLFLTGFELSPTQEQLQSLYKRFHVTPITSRDEKLKIITQATTRYLKESYFGRVRIFELDGIYYIYIQKYGYNLLLKDTRSKNYDIAIAMLFFAAILGMLIFIYVSFIRKLAPLRKLDRQIQRFAEGDLQIHIEKEGNDEIGKIADSFNRAITYINDLIASKNLFMRNMMHELKTPITKGRILAQMVEEEENREPLIRAFERMNEIITELAQVEKIASHIEQLKRKKVRFAKLVEAAKKQLLLDEKREECVKTAFEDFLIDVDPSLFTTVLKNLIDNGIKFSPDHTVTIEATPERIAIRSRGAPLSHPLEYYTEPFSQEHKRDHGFGLGLYIVKSILEAHGFKFGYRHERGENIFEINMNDARKTT